MNLTPRTKVHDFTEAGKEGTKKFHAIALTPELMAYIEWKLMQDRWMPEDISG